MTRSRVVAVTSAKGSPGCSFVALGLAGWFAEAGIPTLLIDADAEEGSLGARLDLPRPSSWRPLGGLGPLTPAALEAATVPAGDRLRCLDVSVDTAGVDGRRLAETARVAQPAVVVDLGHRPDRLQRELVAGADWLLWVVAPDRAGCLRADRALEAAAFPACTAGLVLNRLGPDCLADAGTVLAERHRLPLLARISEAPGAARDASRRSASPVRRREFRRHFEELARCVHPDAGGRGGDTWP